MTAGGAALTGWRVGWTFADGQTITQLWGGRLTSSGSARTVVNESWNGSLGSGGSTTFGFLGTSGGATSVPTATCSSA